MLAEGRRQRGAGLDVLADVGQQLGQARVGTAPGDDVEGLQQRHAGAHHRRQLAREHGDVLLLDGLAARAAPLLDLGDQDALAPQRGADDGFAAGAHLAAHDLAVAVLAFPLEDEFLDALAGRALAACGGRRHITSCRRARGLALPIFDSFERSRWPDARRANAASEDAASGRWCHSLVAASTSSSVVTPARTLTSPDCRKSRTPSARACSAMSMAVPSDRMIR